MPMNKLLVSLLLTLGTFGVVHAEGDAKAGQAKTAVCAACHGPDGETAAPTFPTLAGQSEAYLLKQLTDMRSGKRKTVEMTGLLDKLSDQDLADIAAFYASQNVSVIRSMSN
jgi:cytochrome c553